MRPSMPRRAPYTSPNAPLSLAERTTPHRLRFSTGVHPPDCRTTAFVVETAFLKA